MNSQFTSDSGWIVIWNDIKNGGIPFYIFSAMVFMVFIKPYVKNILSFIGNLITKKERSNKEYTVNEIRNHPIFRDLDFWLTVGIKSLQIANVSFQYPNMPVHNDDIEYLKAKEDIAKDVLKIKLKTINEYLQLFLKETNIEKMDVDTLRITLLTYLKKCDVKQRASLIEEKLPVEFLKKYSVYDKISNDLLFQTIDSFLNESAFDNISVNTRLYLIFSALNNHLANTYNNMIYTVAAINGDLNGIEYKGHIIGKKKQQILKPPHSSYVIPANDKLKSILTEFKASRCALVRYYKNSEDNLLHSTVYEVCSPGITPTLANSQGIPTIDEKDILTLLKNGTNISVDIGKFNSCTRENLSHRGITAVILAPIFSGEEFIGVLFIDYIPLEEYNKIKDMKNIDDILTKYSNELSTYITYPNNYKF